MTWPNPDGPFPQDFGRYRLLAVVGQGGMGTVYRAHDTRLDKQVALKVPHSNLVADDAAEDELEVLERFRREAWAAARFDHPNLCTVYDLGEHDGVPYLAMRYLPGPRLADAPPREPRAAVELVRKLALALAEVHRLHVVHRDLKLSNILLDPYGEPVVTDFGLAIRTDRRDDPLTRPGRFLVSRGYAAPEQFLHHSDQLGPACDVYQLGVILYRLLTGRMPFPKETGPEGPLRERQEQPPPPSSVRADLDPRLDDVCARCLAWRPEDRYPGMDALADALAEVLGPPPAPPPATPPRIPRVAIRFAFVGLGSAAPRMNQPQDRVFLDVGNDLGPGVLDHHHLTAHAGSTAGLVLAYPRHLDAAVRPRRRADDPFTVVLHDDPDLDCLAASYLAVAHLTTRLLPDRADALALYIDRIDGGSPGLTLANPFALYAAYLRLADRLLRRPWAGPAEQWQERLRLGFALLDYVLGEVKKGTPLPQVDAFACPGLFDEADRREVRADAERYAAKLADPRCRARHVPLRLPGQLGGRREAEALLVRDVHNPYDPERCLFFKDWARTDTERCPNGRGFTALSVFVSEGPGQVRRCILSVTPDSEASLRGLGALLDEAESARRRAIHGADDRVTDPATGEPKAPRPGYANADPWYDGRGHRHTIVDSPRSGTVLTADAIEEVFLRFGCAALAPVAVSGGEGD